MIRETASMIKMWFSTSMEGCLPLAIASCNEHVALTHSQLDKFSLPIFIYISEPYMPYLCYLRAKMTHICYSRRLSSLQVPCTWVEVFLHMIARSILAGTYYVFSHKGGLVWYQLHFHFFS
ncbi:hypothetical protein QYE76_052250 [Lolium multiflorum]|uniref:Uncharacterized protein n=1 Tax=Lolium multiflorum TaxID=4521 RepID=A0AAD8WJC4_LOLMU|nr:hypothetical protein QYE76_052250 [Lolium multiflorum]